MLDRDDKDANEKYADRFIGGTIYQAFLSPQDYHRWHSPVDGTIERAVVLPGSYYAVLPDDGAGEGEELEEGDPRGALIRSQGWLTQSSTRALIYIRAKNPDIGLVGFIGVGMAEVSTCELSVTNGQEVRTVDQLGMFHFGGSSHTLIFEPKAKVAFFDHVTNGKHIQVNYLLAHV
ncbi:hypothetical protein H0H81_003076 [Sphagnurus paluster]|uniref:Phosphatidylserine decarboxylase n=1 Tax=Sphagnurus paluster TaxID=117069 RepID=A0A9P7GH68_9AGAR|nr:hypothetical protein H0H81_003076 [Sphagnurus paluster]